jgi:hypothetical protein
MAHIPQIKLKELLQICKEEVKKGNGDKIVLISADEEGNQFNELYYGFSSANDYDDSVLNTKFDKSDVIILG